MIKAMSRAEVNTVWTTGGDFTLTDLRTGVKFAARGSPPIGYNHTDWQYKTETDYNNVLAFAGRKWDARPALLETSSGLICAVSYHTYNHSIRVASGAFDIVSPTLKRTVASDRSTFGSGFERDVNGNWNPGSHMCMHYEDSWRSRSDTNFTRKMRAAVQEAVILANAQQEQFPDSPLLIRGMMNSPFVKEAQTLINALGYTPRLNPDGGFGPLTQAGVEWVQREYGLPVTGMVTLDTWLILRHEEGDATLGTQQIAGTGDNPSKGFELATTWAKDTGVIQGNGEGDYDWQAPMTKEMATQLIYNYHIAHGR